MGTTHELDIAIIGVAGRFPGAGDVDEYWENLAGGVESVRGLPDHELEEAGVPRELIEDPKYVKAASMLDDVDMFDAEFFGYSPREASIMDPQERVFLECAWHALEDAGYAGSDRGGPVGVWGSKSAPTYMIYNLGGGLDPRDFVLGRRNIQTLLGNGDDFLATRVSYRLDLTGPSMRVQTACSSSLVATHLARHSLLVGECDMALAGGVSIYLPQRAGYLYEEGLILSPDGHCRPFDARAAGTIFGRGVGIVVLKRLEDALADGDRVRAVLKGSAVNNDGSGKVGYAAPSVRGQSKVIAEALADAGLSADDIGYVEAHGTGTPQGDPVEVAALTSAFRLSSRRIGDCALGSVKANIGHVDVAAGAASLLKVVAMLEHRQIPPMLHFATSNPDIDFESSPFYVPTELEDWSTSDGRPLRAGISGFGIGGTNAHLVLEEAPQLPRSEEGPERSVHVLSLSANSTSALEELADRYTEELTGRSAMAPGDVCFTANTGRARLPHRLAVTGATTEELGRRVARAARGGEVPWAARGEVGREETAPEIAFLFPGQGAQHAGMGRELFETQPTFRRVMTECSRILAPVLDRPLVDVLYGDDEPGVLDDTEYTQPALFALEYSLATLWRAWGIEPSVVAGHSLGEFAAACFAGVFSLEDGLRLVAERGRLMASLPGGGRMAVAFTDLATVREVLADVPEVTVAAVNGPANVVVSGPREAVATVLRSLEDRQVESRSLLISNGFHSPRVEPILDTFQRAVERIELREPRIPVVSDVTGDVASPEQMTSSRYWRNHLREPVLFQPAVETLVSRGVTDFLEVGPHHTLLGMARESAPAGYGHWHPSLHRERGDWEQLAQSVAALAVRDAPIDWSAFDEDYSRRRVTLPRYPFERQRHWIERESNERVRPTDGEGPHPLLVRRLESPVIEDTVYEGRVGGAVSASLDDHGVDGRPVFPLTGYLELALGAARASFGDGFRRLTDVVVAEPLTLPPGGEWPVQVVLRPRSDGRIAWEVYAPAGDGGEGDWRRHAAGAVSEATGPETVEDAGAGGGGAVPAALEPVLERCGEEVAPAAYYEELGASGLDYGSGFQGIRRLWRGDGEAVGYVEAPTAARTDMAGYVAHPAVVDACLQVAFATFGGPGEGSEPFLPVAVTDVRWSPPLGGTLWSHARAVDGSEDGATQECEVVLRDEGGRVVGRVEGIVLRRAEIGAPSKRQAAEWLHRVSWRRRPLASSAKRAAPDLPSPATVVDALRDRIEALCERHDIGVYDEISPGLDGLAAGYAWAALQELGAGAEVRAASIRELPSALGVEPDRVRFLRRLVEILEEDGLVRREDGVIVFPADVAAPEPACRLAELRDATPGTLEPMWRMIERCGGRLADVLRGRQDPLELLFPGGSLDDLEELYTDSPFARVYNELLREAVGEFLEDLPDGEKIRVLEVGAGTGGTTSALLPLLEGRCSEYVYTDVSALFLERARRRFGAFDFLDFRLFDVEAEPGEQGIEPERFDLVVASNVLHATTDLRRTVDNVRRTLVPGGVLLAVEGVTRQRWVDLVFGITEGWWKFEDRDLRPSYPLLTVEAWRNLLRDRGFDGTAFLPGEEPSGARSDIFGQAVIAARRTTVPATSGVDPENGEGAAGRWLVFLRADDAEGRRAVSALRARGAACDVVLPGGAGPSRADEGVAVRPDAVEEIRALFGREDRELSDPGYRGVLYLWGHADSPPVPSELGTTEPSADALGSAAMDAVVGLLSLVQAMVTDDVPGRPRLWVVTRGARQVSGREEVPGIEHSPLWGFGRVVPLEHPELRCTCVDLDPQDPDGALDLLMAELDADGSEEQVAYRDGERLVPRLERVSAAPGEADGSADAPGLSSEPYRLEVDRPGGLDSLRLRSDDRVAPGPGEVEIAVRSTGLNFKDVLSALGAYPGEAGPLGGECAGVVERVGSGVDGVRPGHAVLAFVPGAFSSHVSVPEGMVVRKPGAWSFDRAASVPAVFLTADFALSWCAGVREDDTVLIHSGAGGVGMAGIQIARAAGARVFATAGTPRKRRILREMGVERAMDSRSPAFGDEVLEATDGRGVDVVVNSLSGELIDESLRVTARGGRFVELGKNDIRTTREVAALGRDIEYHVIDVAEEARSRPAEMGARLRALVERLRRGELKALPIRTYALSRVEEAFRYMSRARHVGKIVVRHGGRPGSGRDAGTLPSAGAWLVVGGLGGLGLLVARWLVDRGAESVVLMGRSAPSEEARDAVAAMEGRGARVTVERADVTREDEVRAVLDRIDATGAGLAGVVQAAGVLDDGVLLQQTPEKFRRVLDAKVRGSWLLHRLTVDRDLDAFVLFSSIASVLGSPGQANHAAANAFLDALAAYRQARGLPGLAINWGPWSELGAAADRGLQDRLAGRGLRPIPPALGLEALELALDREEPDVAVVSADWSAGAPSTLLEDLVEEPDSAAPDTATVERTWAERLDGAPAGRKRETLEAFVRDRVAHGLGLGSDRTIDPEQPLSELGLDSLLAVELRNSLSGGLELDRALPATLLFNYPTVGALTDYLAEEVLELEGTEETEDGEDPASHAEMDVIAALSDEEAEALLIEELEGGD